MNRAILSRSVLSKLIPGVVVAVVLAASFIVRPAGITTALASCTAASIGASPTGTAPASSTIVETAAATCLTGPYGYGYNIPLFRFWERDPGKAWTIVRDYATSNAYNWNTAGLMAGTYYLEVDVRSQDEPSSDVYDAVANMTYILTTPAACTAATLGTAPSGTAGTGASVVMTGGSSTCLNPRYRFWVQDPGRAWSIVQDYSASNTHTWGPVGTYYMGTYKMEVDVRDASETTSYDVVSNTTYTLTGCTVAGLVAAPTTSVHGSMPVVLTASSTCPGTPQYRFWIFDAGGNHWSMVKDYSASNTYNWAAAATSAIGVYKLEVDVRDAGSFEVYERVFNTTYTTT